jgi:hypothetical protein
MAYYFDMVLVWESGEAALGEFERAHPGLRVVIRPTPGKEWMEFVFGADDRETLEQALLDYGKLLWDDVHTPDDLEYHNLSYDDIREGTVS